MNPKQYHSELKSMANALDELSRLEPVQLTVKNVVEEPNGNDWVEPEADDEWWSFWCEVCEIVEGIGQIRPTEDEMHPDSTNDERYMSICADGDYAIFSAQVYGTGHIRVMAEFEDVDTEPVTYGMLFDGYLHIDYNATEVGEIVTELLIGFMTTHGLSSAEALDYWGTEIRNRTQYSWSKKRDTSRQAVNKNVKQAQSKLTE